MFYKSSRGVNRARERIKAMGGGVTQDGDTELGGWVPYEAIDEALKLIRVSRLRPGGDLANLARYRAQKASRLDATPDRDKVEATYSE